jgi:site-specific recombinase XerD
VKSPPCARGQGRLLSGGALPIASPPCAQGQGSRCTPADGPRFLAALANAGTDLRHATVDDVQTALEAMRAKADSTSATGATVNTSIAAVKSFLGFAHKVGFTRFNAAPLIKLRKAPRTLAQRLLSDIDVTLLIRAAKPGRDRLLLQVAYYGALRVSELASLTWGQVMPRETGEAQLARGAVIG